MADFRERRWVPTVLIATVVALVGYAIVAISVGEGGPVAVEIDGSDAVQRQYGGLPQDEAALGSEDAPVTVRLFTDVQCSDCARWYFGVVPALVDGYVRDGDLRIELRHFSLGAKTTQLAAIGAAAAADQGREFQFAHLFMLNLDKVPESGVNDEFLLRIASAVPRMQGGVWEEAFEDPETEAAAREDTQVATELRFPTGSAVIVEGPSGSEELTEDPSVAEIERAIAAAAG
jgi:protein-disulfide isomerase